MLRCVGISVGLLTTPAGEGTDERSLVGGGRGSHALYIN